MLTMLDLFSGIGGFSLAGHWAGFQTIAFSEIDPFCCRVIAHHFPGIPNLGDIRTADFSVYRGRVDLLTGGFPCQPFSRAGNRKGKADNRYLWPAMLQAISDCLPTWIVGENVDGIVDMELECAIADLESIGYAVWTPEIPACAVEAWHNRNRVWIIANYDRIRHSQKQAVELQSAFSWFDAFDDADGCDANAEANRMGGCSQPLRAAGELLRDKKRNDSPQEQSRKQFIRRTHTNTNSPISERHRSQTVCDLRGLSLELHGSSQGMRERSVVFEPKLCRDIHGIPNGVDRLRALGNTIVPQVAFPILKSIAMLIKSRNQTEIGAVE